MYYMYKLLIMNDILIRSDHDWNTAHRAEINVGTLPGQQLNGGRFSHDQLSADLRRVGPSHRPRGHFIVCRSLKAQPRQNGEHRWSRRSR